MEEQVEAYPAAQTWFANRLINTGCLRRLLSIASSVRKSVVIPVLKPVPLRPLHRSVIRSKNETDAG
jgi:hypothetical protein